ncbi:holin, partial [Lachnospiraceae bacterium]|nr:holin [Lachnospiraceae bacterium]
GMWLLIVVGAIIDQTLLYTSDMVGIRMPFTFLVACIVALWIICNEVISILENVKDMGVNIPGFLEPLVRHIKSQVEEMGEQQERNVKKKHREGE